LDGLIVDWKPKRKTWLFYCWVGWPG